MTVEMNNPKTKIVIPAIKNWTAPTIMSRNLISPIQTIQANAALAVVQSLPSIPKMTVADLIPRHALDMVIEVSGLNQQMQGIAQIVDNAMTVYAKDMMRVTGVLNAVQDAMQGQLNGLSTTFSYLAQVWREQWLSSIASVIVHIGPSIRRVLCMRAAHALFEGDTEETLYFTTRVCGLPPTYQAYVEIALWEGRWQQADDPVAYICRVAHNKMRNRDKEDNTWWHPKAGHILALDEPMEGGNPRGYLLPDSHDQFRQVELLLELEQLFAQANLPPEVVQLMVARAIGYKRRDVGSYLKWDKREVERVWRIMNRRLEDFKRYQN